MGWRRDGIERKGKEEIERKGREEIERIMRMAGLHGDDDNRSTSQENRVGRYG